MARQALPAKSAAQGVIGARRSRVWPHNIVSKAYKAAEFRHFFGKTWFSAIDRAALLADSAEAFGDRMIPGSIEGEFIGIEHR